MNQRTLLYTLVGSVILNAFLLGVISVHLFSRRSSFGGRGHGRPEVAIDGASEHRSPRLFRQLVRAAGGPGDPRVRELWSGRRQHLGEVRAALSSAREEIREVLEQEPFDREALARALNAAQQARQRADQMATEGALDLAEKLTPQERKTLREVTETPPTGPREGADRQRRKR